LIRRKQYGLSIREAVRNENRRIEKDAVEKNLDRCMNRMFGDVNPYKRNEDYPFVWHN
jgi:hypothetical protein